MLSRSLASLAISSSTLSALHKAGFETVADLGSLNADQLSEELNLPVFLCEEIISISKVTSTPAFLGQQTWSASFLLNNNPIIRTSCGLKCGHVLELSGPPGSPNENIMLDFVRNTVTSGNDAIFVDTQDMTTPFTLKNELKDIPGSFEAIHYIKCISLPDLMVFFHSLTSFLDQYPKTTLLVLNTLSSPFHSTSLTTASRSSLLDQIKSILAKNCALRRLSVITMVQMATKLLSENGSNASPNNAVKAIMVPQLSDSYLPSGRSYRLMLIPDTPQTGMIRLLSSPSKTVEELRKDLVQQAYELVKGRIQGRGGE
ncbi:P-loop containing nucleoside triphosphate hydrolase [Pyrrhoderma noxium]|uniref:P-loop containing nucleoside triphosphate hydrolase n=1 Tax=Pyrrhoderma noxium TaxID=2282107 RepID=A0A286U6L8_9AGAM|nr:P-loop containing nucleoside triphosphate hydrolase [Pyrrhoderma noxium]